MKIIGITTIHPALFYTGKIAGYTTWIISLLAILGFPILGKQSNGWILILAYLLFAFGLIVAILSLFDLGQSTRLGLPVENTKFVSKGLYRFSRNPMYVGFNLLTLASIIYIWSPIIVAAGVYSIIIYHLIILGEEKFLQKKFGDIYFQYKAKVRRYF